MGSHRMDMYEGEGDPRPASEFMTLGVCSQRMRVGNVVDDRCVIYAMAFCSLTSPGTCPSTR